jgi:dephospho-CoA kinase
MLHVGITGGIGSGKTTACKIFETLGIPVYYADARAKWLMENDGELRTGIIQHFGSEAYSDAGKLNRGWIASKVLSDPALLHALNALVHPAVALDGLRWQEAQREVPYTLKEAALLYESGSFRLLDKIIVVTAPLEVRIARVMERDKASRETVMGWISKQMPEEEKAARADYLIQNDGEHPLLPQVMEVHLALVALGLHETP